jgi:hypothetical protein
MCGLLFGVFVLLHWFCMAFLEFCGITLCMPFHTVRQHAHSLMQSDAQYIVSDKLSSICINVDWCEVHYQSALSFFVNLLGMCSVCGKRCFYVQ